MRTFRFRARQCEQEIADWFDAQDEADRGRGSQALWVYRDPEARALIDSAVAGETSCSAVLGYPECCVRHQFERLEQMTDMLIRGIKKKFGVREPGDVIKLLAEDVEVPFEASHVHQEMEASHLRFHYVQFNSCSRCLTATASPAERTNRAFRDLACQLSPKFGRDIWAAQLETNGYDPAAIAQKAPYPCGSGKKFKHCCARLAGS